MDTTTRLQLAASHMELEPAEDTGVAPCGVTVSTRRSRLASESLGIHEAVLAGGQRVPLLKTMQTTACERNCYYCPFRAGRNYRRLTYKPDDLAADFMQLHAAGLVKGIFLSSGIIGGGVRAQDKMLATVELLRHKYRFRGYVHLKIMPGAEHAQVERAMQLADRLSVNLEGPTADRLAALAPKKHLTEELLRPLRWIEGIRRTQPAQNGWNGRWPSSVTQFVVGAVGDTDLELLRTTAYLQQKARLRRAYYSAFRPVPDTPLEDLAPTPLRRQDRLYQASYLLRDYGWELEELPFTGPGNLRLDIDPKEAWARDHLAQAPVELNRAARRDLLRVPGIGPKSADTLLQARRRGRLSDLSHLRQLGIPTKRLAPYVLLDGKRPPQQMRLF